MRKPLERRFVACLAPKPLFFIFLWAFNATIFVLTVIRYSSSTLLFYGMKNKGVSSCRRVRANCVRLSVVPSAVTARPFPGVGGIGLGWRWRLVGGWCLWLGGGILLPCRCCGYGIRRGFRLRLGGCGRCVPGGFVLRRDLPFRCWRFMPVHSIIRSATQISEHKIELLQVHLEIEVSNMLQYRRKGEQI